MKILWYLLLVNCCLMTNISAYKSSMHQMSYAQPQLHYEKARFSESNKNEPGDINSYILNTEVADKKVSANPSDEEQEVYPTTASASSSHLKKSFLFFNWGGVYAPEDTISGHDGKWMSNENSKYEYLIHTFEMPTKIDIMQILWEIPPTSFLVEFNVEDKGKFIPLTRQEIKYHPINEKGERQTISYVSMENTLYFKKPIHAKNIKINMWDPLKNKQFAVDKVKFYNIKSFITIVNQTVNECANYCMYVNTDKPKVGTLVEAADCLSGMSLGDNREVFELSFDRSLRTFNNRLCVGFHTQTSELQLYECQSPAQYKIIFNQDGSLSFKYYEKMCIYIDKSANLSDNYVKFKNENDIQVSSTFEGQSEKYKKSNVVCKHN